MRIEQKRWKEGRKGEERGTQSSPFEREKREQINSLEGRRNVVKRRKKEETSVEEERERLRNQRGYSTRFHYHSLFSLSDESYCYCNIRCNVIVVGGQREMDEPYSI